MVNVFLNQSDPGGSFWPRGPWEGSKWGYPEQGVPKMLCIPTDSRALCCSWRVSPVLGALGFLFAPSLPSQSFLSPILSLGLFCPALLTLSLSLWADVWQ